MVIKLRSRADNSFSLAQTSPNKTSSFSAANCGAKSPNCFLPAVCFFINYSTSVNAAYASSLTGSSHSLVPFVIAIWLIQWSFVAPCQCLIPSWIVTTSPGRNFCAGLPASWYQPSPRHIGDMDINFIFRAYKWMQIALAFKILLISGVSLA